MLGKSCFAPGFRGVTFPFQSTGLCRTRTLLGCLAAAEQWYGCREQHSDARAGTKSETPVPPGCFAGKSCMLEEPEPRNGHTVLLAVLSGISSVCLVEALNKEGLFSVIA